MAAYPLPVSDYYTYNQFLEINDAAQNVKYEYHRGRVFAMAGGNFRHNLIKDNISEHIRPRLRGKGYTMTSDMQLRISENAAFYPDVLVVCGKPKFYKHLGQQRDDILTNATGVFEVLSESTRNFDKGDKSDEYRALTDLQEYFLVEQDRAHVTHYYRQGQAWACETYDELSAVISLRSAECKLSLEEIYRDVAF